MTDRPRVVALTGGLMGDAPPPLEALAPLAEVTVASSAQELEGALTDAAVLFVWDYRFENLADLLPAAPMLRWIHVAGVGVDPVLSPELVANDIVVTNSRGVFDGAIAEYVLAVILAHTKSLHASAQDQAQRRWRHRVTPRLGGQHAVVVGTGSIGRRIAHTLAALDVQVTLVGRRAAEDPEFGQIRPSSELVDAVRGHDYLVLACPLTETTRGMVGRDVLAALGPSGYLVNVARGAVTVEDELVEALQSGGIAGAALDVFHTEPLPEDSPLWGLPNVFVSAHMSADYLGFAADLVELFAANLRLWAKNEPLQNVVDKALGYVPSRS